LNGEKSSNKKVVVLGGSVAGLIASREISRSNIDVTVFEEHREIGVPEKCDGLVSSSGIEELGILPPSYVIQNRLSRARFFSPSFKEIAIDARKQRVIVLDRNKFDKHIAELAARNGAKIEVGKRVSQSTSSEEKISVQVEKQSIQCDYLLDCGGYESYINSGGDALQGGQYLAYGKWFDKDTVEVYFDPVETPGFFKWVIPLSSDTAKIGAAGEAINTFQVLDKFVKEKGAVVFRKMAAPVLCFGTSKSFVKGRVVLAGDAAGQAKPTTGGGIYTGGYGGMLAGRSVSEAIAKNDSRLLTGYEEAWNSKFGKEFRLQSYARKVFSNLKREQVDRLFEMVSASDLPKRISEEGDFDRHSIAIMKAFGLANIVSAFGMLFTNELRQMIGV
jgi:digeranylgeranylglycerophospholipid reductase